MFGLLMPCFLCVTYDILSKMKHCHTTLFLYLLLVLISSQLTDGVFYHCEVQNQNITVDFGATNVLINLTNIGYYGKTSTNKVMYTTTWVESGQCAEHVSYNMPASITH